MIARNLINGIIGTNVAVFCGWQYSNMRAMGPDRDYRPLNWIYNNFTCSPYNLSNGRVWTLLSCTFSHSSILHLGINCYVLYQFAPYLLSILGTRTFMAFYCGSGVVSSLASVNYKKYYHGNQYKVGSLGASGSICSLMAVITALQPGMNVALFGIIPLPISIAFAGMIGWDIFSILRASNSGTDSMGHVGGALSGYLFYLWRFKKLRF
jgi:rhomboid-like protein